MKYKNKMALNTKYVTQGPKIDILIADDASLFRDFVKGAASLAKLEANFIEVTDGKELFSAYEQHVPEIIIIDGDLPNMDVLDSVKKIIEIHPIASVIVVVESIKHSFMKQAIQVGVKKVVTRTVDQFTLGSLIKKFVTAKIEKYPEFKKKAKQYQMNALTLMTLSNSKETKNYVRHVNDSIQKQLEKIEKIKSLGDGFGETIKNLRDKNEQYIPPHSPNFFMKELSNETLTKILESKTRQLDKEKQNSTQCNTRLQETLAQLETRTKELEKQKEELEQEVEKKTEKVIKTEQLSALGHLSARVAHDLRNPLSVIKNTTEILHFTLKEFEKEKTEHQWKRLDRAIYRMSHQLEDVMDFVRKTPLKRCKTNLSTILHDVTDRIPFPNNIVLHPPFNDVELNCDYEKIEIVFVNLITNAIQAMSEKYGDVWIEIHDDKNSIQIKIIDNGPGIPKKLISKIFDPLFTTRQIGTGLGLPSCKNIIELHDGTISVQSIVGQGTTFTIMLPKSEWESIGNAKHIDSISATMRSC